MEPSVQRFVDLKSIEVELSLSASKEDSDSLLKDLMTAFSNLNRGMKIQPVELQLQRNLVILKKRIIGCDFRQAVHNALNALGDKRITESVQFSSLCTSIVTPLKYDGKTPRIYGDYRLKLNCRLVKQA
ncbi:unnamed protein product [Schistosoma curassoni]|uniref:Uncharacterized protein n=1 Tax=Schistosoma curassoni TaxID=6186 RepID=A0A183KKA7_9TREM|nr:unnamed protein product [Schistosoma curassoni]